jgi:hypothetical protein
MNVRGGRGRRAEQHRRQHQPGAVGAAHQERPDHHISPAQPQAHPAHVHRPWAEQLEQPQTEEQRGAEGAHDVETDDRLQSGDQAGGQGNRRLVAEGNWWQGEPDSPAPTFLQTKHDRQKPAHGRIDAVKGAQPSHAKQRSDPRLHQAKQ